MFLGFIFNSCYSFDSVSDVVSTFSHFGCFNNEWLDTLRCNLELLQPGSVYEICLHGSVIARICRKPFSV